MDPEMLTELLAGKHFDMEERAARGAWPHGPLSFQDLKRHLAGVLKSRRWFPCAWVIRPSGAPVADRTVVERQRDDCYVVRFERSGAWMNLAASGERVFQDSEAAAEFYLRTELNLPGSLDSWRVVE